MLFEIAAWVALGAYALSAAWMTGWFFTGGVDKWVSTMSSAAGASVLALTFAGALLDVHDVAFWVLFAFGHLFLLVYPMLNFLRAIEPLYPVFTMMEVGSWAARVIVLLIDPAWGLRVVLLVAGLTLTGWWLALAFFFQRRVYFRARVLFVVYALEALGVWVIFSLGPGSGYAAETKVVEFWLLAAHACLATFLAWLVSWHNTSDPITLTPKKLPLIAVYHGLDHWSQFYFHGGT